MSRRQRPRPRPEPPTRDPRPPGGPVALLRFDLTHTASVAGGPTDQPLVSLPVSVDSHTGTISLIG